MNLRLLCTAVVLATSLVLAACNNTESATATAEPVPAVPAETAVAETPVTDTAMTETVSEPAADPVEATPATELLAGAGDSGATAAPRSLADYQKSLARRCETDADCMVKNVGSCCGYTPQCVHKEVQTFPEQVKALCEQEGRSSICGFQEPAGCSCVNNQCRESAGSGI